MSQRERHRPDPSDPFPLIVWDEPEEETAVAVAEPEEPEAPAAPVIAPVAVAAPKVETKKIKAVPAALPKIRPGIDVGFWMKTVLALGGAAAAAALVAGIVWWRRPAPQVEAAVERPFDVPALAGAIEDVERSLVRAEEPATGARAGLRYGYVAGDVLSYNFEFIQNITVGVSPLFMQEAERRGAKVTASQGTDTRLGWRLGGKVDLAVYEAGEKMIVGWRFTQMSLDLRGDAAGKDPEGLGALRSELNREVLVAMTPLGKIETLHFPKGTSPWAESLLSTAVLLVRVSFPEKETPSWRVSEEDSTGRYIADYRAEGGYRGEDGSVTRIARTKAGFERIACTAGDGAAELPADAAKVSLEGGAVVLWDPEKGRCRTFRVDEKNRVEGIAFAQEISTTMAGGMRLSGAARDENLAANGAALAKALLDGSDVVKPGTADIAARLAGDSEEARLKAMTGGLSIDDAIAQLQALAERDEMDSPEASELGDRIIAILRSSSAAVDIALEVIRQGTAPMAVRAALVDLLGAAETPKAQEALLEVVKEGSLDADLRANAVTGLAMADVPVAGVEGAVRGVMEAGSNDPASPAALLGFGMIARRAAAADGARAGELADLLKSAGRVSGDPEWQSMYLESLGNAGLPETLSEVEKFLSRDDVRVRARATYALRFVAGDRALTLLAQAVRGDAAPQIRMAAAQALAIRGGEESRKALEPALQDPVPQIRAVAEGVLKK